MKGNIAKLLLAVTFMTAGTLTFTPRAEAANPIKVAYAFSGKPAANPVSGLVADASGNLYGTASTNNGQCCGLVFKMTPQAGGGSLLRVIYEFHGSDGSYPNGLIIDSAGRLYGTTYEGGAYGFGTVFVLYPTKNGWVEEVLHSFDNLPDFQLPQGSLTRDAAGNLYGTAPAGGTNTYCPGGCGGVFKLSRTGSQFEETEIYNFTGLSDGAAPASNVIFDTADNLYGTASTSYSLGNWGTVFELSRSNNGEWTEKTLYTFTGAADGATPLGGLIFDAIGNLYGTTNAAANSKECNGVGCGTVFELSPDGAGNWTFNVLLAFDGSNGGWPRFSLVSDSSGNLYGPAPFGGANGLGVVFKLSQSSGTWTETFASFNSSNGANPDGPLLLQNGFAYGTASNGGKGYGVIFDIKL